MRVKLPRGKDLWSLRCAKGLCTKAEKRQCLNAFARSPQNGFLAPRDEHDSLKVISGTETAWRPTHNRRDPEKP